MSSVDLSQPLAINCFIRSPKLFGNILGMQIWHDATAGQDAKGGDRESVLPEPLERAIMIVK